MDAVIERSQTTVSYGLTFHAETHSHWSAWYVLSLNNTASRGDPHPQRTPRYGLHLRRKRTLPLLKELGDALRVYLRQERPQSAERSIFLTLLPPYRPLAWSTAISQISKRILKKAGVEGPRLGAHRLRHTIATHMVRRGSSFKEVADVLGHKSLRSTGIYAKLDERALEQVALPWPGGVP